MRVVVPFRLPDAANEGAADAAMLHGAFNHRACHLGRHLAEVFQRVALVADAANVHFFEPCACCRRVEEQTDVHTVVILKDELPEQGFARGNDAAQRLDEVGQLREVSAHERARGEGR